MSVFNNCNYVRSECSYASFPVKKIDTSIYKRVTKQLFSKTKRESLKYSAPHNNFVSLPIPK